MLDVRSGEAEPASVTPVRHPQRRRSPMVVGLAALAVVAALVAFWLLRLNH